MPGEQKKSREAFPVFLTAMTRQFGQAPDTLFNAIVHASTDSGCMRGVPSALQTQIKYNNNRVRLNKCILQCFGS